MIPGTETDVVADDELAAACGRRDSSPRERARAEVAFRTLYDRHARRLVAFLSGRVAGAALDDVHQTVWVKVWQAIPTFQGGNFRAWVHQIARNVIVDHQRKRRHESLPADGELADPRSGNTRAADVARRDALAKCLQKLERANAEAAGLVRSRVAGESYEAICARTGMPTDRAYRAFHQAKAQLQACMERIA